MTINSPKPGGFIYRFVVSISLVLILTTSFFYTIENFNQQAEKIARDAVIDELNIALSFHLYRAAISGKLNDLAELQQGNPFEILAGQDYKLPENYRGEVASTQRLNKPGWYFDVDKRVIFFWHESKVMPAYQLLFAYTDLNRNGEFEAGEDRIDQLKMRLVK